MKDFPPLIIEVIQAQLLDKWKWPKENLYDETLDLDAHVKAYMTQVNLFSKDLRVHFRLFPGTLKGITL